MLSLALLLALFALPYGMRRVEWAAFCRDWWQGFRLVNKRLLSLTTANSATVGVGTGTSITFGTSSWTSNLLDVQWSGIKRKQLDTSYMGTTALTSNATQFGSMTFIPSSLSDPGSLKLKFQFNPDKVPIIDTAAETITVTWPKGANSAGATWAGTGFVTDFEISAQLETIMEATVTVKMSGNVSFTKATA